MARSLEAPLLGPVARKLISTDNWTDAYPAHEAWVRELDVLLHFADRKGYLARFLGPLRSRNHQRDEALNELRVAYLFDSLGFPIIHWDPPGANSKVGEFMLGTPEKKSVFTELKSPGWESELRPEEIAAGRQWQPKYNGADGGAVGNFMAVHQCIARPNCYPKFTNNQPNLLIIADDLKISLHDSLFQVEGALSGEKWQYGQDGYFKSNQYENIGGLGVFGSLSQWDSRGLEYQFAIFENPNALPAVKLPPSLLQYKEPFVCIVNGTDPRRPAPVRL